MMPINLVFYMLYWWTLNQEKSRVYGSNIETILNSVKVYQLSNVDGYVQYYRHLMSCSRDAAAGVMQKLNVITFEKWTKLTEFSQNRVSKLSLHSPNFYWIIDLTNLQMDYYLAIMDFPSVGQEFCSWCGTSVSQSLTPNSRFGLLMTYVYSCIYISYVVSMYDHQ